MKPRLKSWSLALCMAAALAAASCSKNPMAPETSSGPPSTEPPPNAYPAIPRPTSPDEIIPDTSAVFSTLTPIVGKQLDFAPTWEAGRFTWDVDIQTQYERCPVGICTWYGDPPGDYWNGTSRSEDLKFEGGVVDLRNPTPIGTSWRDPFPRRVQFIKDGEVLAKAVNPQRSEVLFQFQDYPEKRLPGALFGGYVELPVDPAFGERERRRAYYVAATQCPPLTKAVYLKRERLWKRVPLVSNGSALKSIRVDPGATFEVSYSRTQGANHTDSYTFTRTLSGEIGADVKAVNAKLGGSLSEAFGESVEVHDDSTVTVSRTMTGMPDKTVVYAVWTSIERYSFVDQDGNPYSDPNFKFSDLGNVAIQGEYEWISSTAFDYK
jgi:hypothetical protein